MKVAILSFAVIGFLAGQLAAQEAAPAEAPSVAPASQPATLPVNDPLIAAGAVALPGASPTTLPATANASSVPLVPGTQPAGLGSTQPASPGTQPATASVDPRQPGGDPRGSSRSSKSGKSDRGFERDDKAALVESPFKLPPAKKLEDKYASLISHSIFVKGRQAPPVQVSTAGTRDSTIAAPPPRNPESGLVLRGVVMEDAGQFAFIEDLDHQRILKMQTGEKVARGKIAGLSLTELSYEMNGKAVPVQIGYSFDGVKMQPVAAPVVAIVRPAATLPSTQPGTLAGTPGAGQPVATPGGVVPGAAAATGVSADMLERMRLRRAAEGGR